MKKIIALILSAVMLLTLVPVAFAAQTADGVGSVASGYTPEGVGIDSLDKITDPAGKYYLTKDITAERMRAIIFFIVLFPFMFSAPSGKITL